MQNPFLDMLLFPVIQSIYLCNILVLVRYLKSEIHIVI